jgi:hypothetical protein
VARQRGRLEPEQRFGRVAFNTAAIEQPLAEDGLRFRVPAPGGGHTTASGSSFAAAHATGMLARVMSRFPGLPPAFAREALLHLAQQGTAPADARPV